MNLIESMASILIKDATSMERIQIVKDVLAGKAQAKILAEDKLTELLK